MKIKIAMSLIILMTMTSFNLLAQTRSRLSKVGFVDSAAIFNSILEDKALLQIIDIKFENDKKTLDSIIEEIKLARINVSNLEKQINQPQAGDDISKLKTNLSKLKSKLEDLESKYEKLSPVVNMQKSKKNQAINLLVQRYIAGSIITITRREGYTAILERKDSGILYVDKDFDITSQILAFVRESIKKSLG